MNLPAIGLGCMNVSHAYGTPPSEADGLALLHAAVVNALFQFNAPKPLETAEHSR